MVFNEDDWREYEERYIDPLNTYDDFEDDWDSRFIFSRMSSCVPDKQGRVSVLQPILKALICGQVMILGNRNRLEIWNPATLAEETEKYQQRKARRDAKRDGAHES